VFTKILFEFRRCAPVLLAFLLAGCLSARREVDKKLPAVQSRWQTELARQIALPDRIVSWPEALALLQTNNLKLRAARVDITNAQELARQVFKDLIPTVNLRSGVSRSIKSIPATAFSDVTFNIDSFFNIPGVVNFDSRLFAARLAALRAKAAAELAQREQAIELYKLFLEAREQDEMRAELKSERMLAAALDKADALAGDILLKEIESEELSLKTSAESLQTHASELLADTQYHWTFRTNNLPDFPYEEQPLPLNNTNRVARLQMRLVALELVRAWAQIHGIKLQYWPELTIFVSGPSAFQSVNGETHFWSSSDVVATADFFWTLDTRGYVSLQLRQTRREQELEFAQLRMDSDELIQRLLAAQRLGGSLRTQIEQLDRLISALNNVPQDLDLNSLIQAMESNRSLRFQRFKLRRDLAELDTLFWFVDEQQWGGIIE
jgi:outer membrane protein TolC